MMHMCVYLKTTFSHDSQLFVGTPCILYRLHLYHCMYPVVCTDYSSTNVCTLYFVLLIIYQCMYPVVRTYNSSTIVCTL